MNAGEGIVFVEKASGAEGSGEDEALPVAEIIGVSHISHFIDDTWLMKVQVVQLHWQGCCGSLRPRFPRSVPVELLLVILDSDSCLLLSTFLHAICAQQSK